MPITTPWADETDDEVPGPWHTVTHRKKRRDSDADIDDNAPKHVRPPLLKKRFAVPITKPA
eukprot:5899361-Alexandrium_andersonii.AAC.1